MKQFSLLTVTLFFLFDRTFAGPRFGWREGSGSGSGSYSSGSSSAGGGVGIVVGENYILKPSDVISIEVYQESRSK